MHYLDHGTATPLLPEALAAMRGTCSVGGNPSSQHGLGRRARRIVEDAASAVRCLVHSEDAEVVFTANGLEATVLAMHGIIRLRDSAAVVMPQGLSTELAAAAGEFGAAQVLASPGELRENAGLLVVPWADESTGDVEPLEAWCHCAAQRSVPVHLHASDGLGKGSVDFDALGIASLGFCGHKIGGPTGVGALVLRKGLVLPPLWGGNQYRGMRPGTEPITLIAGLGAASKKVMMSQQAQWTRLQVLRDILEQRLLALDGLRVRRAVNGKTRFAANLAFALDGWSALALASYLDSYGIMVRSSSHWVIVSLGWSTAMADIDAAADALGALVAGKGGA